MAVHSFGCVNPQPMLYSKNDLAASRPGSVIFLSSADLTMADIFLIVAITVALLLLFVVAFYLLVYYQHPDDKNDAYIPKIVVVFGFVIAGITVLLLPLDVANNEGYAGCDGYDTAFCGGLNMELFWDIIFWLIPIWIFILIPLSTFYYEADDGMLMAGTAVGGAYKSRLGQALCSQAVVMFVVGLVFALTYLFLSDTTIPVQEYTGALVSEALTLTRYETDLAVNLTSEELLNFSTSNIEDIMPADMSLLNSVDGPMEDTITLQVDVATFYAGLMAWLGWFLFAIFGGIGMVALPMDFWFTFKARTRILGAVELAEAKLELQERCNAIVEIGEQLKVEREDKQKIGGLKTNMWSLNSVDRKEARQEAKTMREFQTAVYQLESDLENFEACSDAREQYNPIVPYAAFLLAIVSFLISIFWLIHIIVYVFPDPPLAPFLNNYFQWFDKWFPLFGVLSVALFTVYLLFAAVKGCFKFGLRFLLISLHPMKVGRTYMSSFMFNIALVLFCALPVVQFATEAFSEYARNTTIIQLFGIQIENLDFFNYFWTNNVFIYAFLAISFLTLVFLCCKGRNEAAASDALRNRVKSR